MLDPESTRIHEMTNVTKIHSQETTSLGDMRTWAAMCWTPYPNTYHGGCRENSTSYKFYCWVITIQPCQTNSKTLISIHVLILLQIANHHALRKTCNHVTPHYFTDIPCNYEYLLPQQHHERERERESHLDCSCEPVCEPEFHWGFVWLNRQS